MNLSLIVAIADNSVIGRQNQLPWHLPADLKKFKALTMGHPIIMGRKTFDSIGRALPGRTNIVITRNREFAAPPAVLSAASLDDALSVATRSAGSEEIFVIGGAEIYRLALTKAKRCYVTRVHIEAEGDAFLKDFPGADFELIESLPLQNDEAGGLSASFEVYQRH
jgi:dihydrofolate reductase